MKYFLFITILFLFIGCEKSVPLHELNDAKLKTKLDQKNGFREFILGTPKDSLDLSNLDCKNVLRSGQDNCYVINYEKYLGAVPIDNLNLTLEENILKEIHFTFPDEGNNQDIISDIFSKEYGNPKFVDNKYISGFSLDWYGEHTTLSIIYQSGDDDFYVIFRSESVDKKIKKLQNDRYAREHQKEGNKVKL